MHTCRNLARGVSIFLLAGVSPAFAQDLSRRFSYTTVAVPASRALAEISELTKVRLEASAATANEIVVLRLKDTSVEEAMKRMAACMHAGWEKTDAGYRLIRTDAMRRKEKEDEFAEEARLFREAAKRQRVARERLGSFDKAMAKSLAIQLDDLYKRQHETGFMDSALMDRDLALRVKTPSGRLAARIAEALDPETLAGLPFESRTVFSNKPTRMQRPLPRAAMPALDSYVKEQAVWADEAGPVFGAASSEGFLAAAAPIDTVLVVVNHENRMGQATIQVSIYDAKGAEITNAGASLTEDFTALSQAISEPQRPGEQKIELSARAQEIRIFLRARSAQLSSAPSADLRKALLHPEEADPLSFVPSEGLILTGQQRKENVVAVLPDIVAVRRFDDPLYPTNFLAAMRLWQMSVREEAGWLEASPRPASIFRETRCNRPALGVLLRTLDRKATVTIEEMAQYAATTHGVHRDILATTWMSFLAPYAELPAALNNTIWTWDVLRLYGSLTPSQVVEMESPQGISLRQLTGGQQAVADYLVYGRYGSLRYDPHGDPGLAAQGWLYWGGIAHEPTVALPNGIPPDGRLRMSSTAPAVVFLGDNKQPLSAEGLAWEVFTEEHPEIYAPTGDQSRTNLENLRLGTSRQVYLNFNFTDALLVETGLRECARTSSSATKLDNLPRSFRDQYQQALDKYRKSMIGASPDAAPPKRPPPPR